MPHIELNDCRLHYRLDGDTSQPVLIFSNSLGTNLHIWDRVLPALIGHFRILRYDTRGHGESSAPEGAYTIEILGQDVLSLLDALAIDRCRFCGVSLGGLTGIWLGIHARERVDRLILSNTAARIGTIDGWNDRICRVKAVGIDAVADEIIARWLTPSFRQGYPERTEELRADLAACSREGYAGCCAALRDTDLTSQLHLIRGPALVVAGTFDPAVPTSQSRVLHEQIRRAKYLELPSAHLSPVEKPQEFVNAAMNFLASQEQEHHG